MPESNGQAVFLSYASQDGAAALRIATALRGAGVEVWFDQSELVGGDAWDAKIRQQIAECALFVPIISANTQARGEGYFRIEWRLAAQRTHAMAEDQAFLLPVVIDNTRDAEARVPGEFKSVQWTRLPNGEPTPLFSERVKALLGGVGRAPGLRPAGPGGAGLATRTAKPRLPAAIAIGAAAAVGVGFAAIFFATRKAAPKADAGTRLPLAENAAAPAPLSEARKLVDQARRLYEPWDLATPDDFALAEQLLARAVTFDPGDAEAWASYALVACGRRVMLDFSDASALAARLRADKAIRLAPDLPLARFARAFSLRFDPQTTDEAIRLLREEAARQPANRFVVRTVGAALRTADQFEQSLVYFDKADALPGKDPITAYNRGLSLKQLGRFEEAEAAFDAALAVAPHYAAANFEKLNLLLDIRRDIPRAQAHLARIPSDPISNQSTALNAYNLAIYLKQPARALAALRQTGDFLIGFGPKATLTAVAHRRAGNEEAARTDLKAALRLLEERLTTQPNDTLLLVNKAEILALLGERVTAEPLVREFQQRIAAGDQSGTPLNDQSFSNERLAYLFMLLGQPEAALTALEARFATAVSGFQYRSKSSLRYDPVWDPLRGHPRFEALLAAPEARK